MGNKHLGILFIIKTNIVKSKVGELWCLTPLSTIFQLYRGGSSYQTLYIHRCIMYRYVTKTKCEIISLKGLINKNVTEVNLG